MKKLLLATAVAMTLSTAVHADAQSSTQLKVVGLLTNDACTPVVTNNSEAAFGTHLISDLKATEDNQMGYRDLMLSIECGAPSKVAWSISDNKQSTVARMTIDNATFKDAAEAWSTETLFGAGTTAGNVNIGAWSISVDYSNSLMDGVKTPVLYGDSVSVSQGTTWIAITSDVNSLLRNDGDLYLTFSNTGGANPTPTAFTNGSFPIRVALAIEDTDTLAITDKTLIEGSGTITLHYL